MQSRQRQPLKFSDRKRSRITDTGSTKHQHLSISPWQQSKTLLQRGQIFSI
jgi:hypothetical protein